MSRPSSPEPGGDLIIFGILPLLAVIALVGVFALGGVSLYPAGNIDPHQVTQQVSPQIEAAAGGAVRDLHCADDGYKISQQGDFTYCAFYDSQVTAKMAAKVTVASVSGGAITTTISDIRKMPYGDNALAVAAETIYRNSPTCSEQDCLLGDPRSADKQRLVVEADARQFGISAYGEGSDLERADEFFWMVSPSVLRFALFTLGGLIAGAAALIALGYLVAGIRRHLRRRHTAAQAGSR